VGGATAGIPALGALAPATEVIVPAAGCPTMFGLIGVLVPPPDELEQAANNTAPVQHQRVLTLMTVPSDCSTSRSVTTAMTLPEMCVPVSSLSNRDGACSQPRE
jgi:hypothetical protein